MSLRFERALSMTALILLIFLGVPIDARAESKADCIESFLQTARSRGQFNGCVLVGERGRILYTRALGFADFEKRTSLRTDSVFELASVSKPFTALAILMLKERGRLSYDDPLTRYLPELPYSGVTIRHLLTHTAGLPEPEPFFGSDWPSDPPDRPVTISDFVARLARRKTPVFFAPGERWKYDRTAYFLLARIVEIVSGTSYEQFLQTNIFKPLGMKCSFVYSTQGIRKSSHLAQGYVHASLASDTYVLPETLPRYSYTRYFGDAVGPMGVYSSVGDLFRWVQGLNAGKLITRKTLDEAYTPVTLKDGSTAGAGGGAGNGAPSQYGYGWFLQQGEDGRTVRHTGDWRGYITCVIHNLTKDQTIIVLTNVGDMGALEVANALENILNGHAYTLPRMSIGREIGKTILASGIESAVRRYRALKQSQPNDYDFDSSNELNALGYELLRRGEREPAIAVFKLNVEAFPDFWNVYDSLGEALLAAGHKALAIENYRRSVELNPDNKSGTDLLKRLEAD